MMVIIVISLITEDNQHNESVDILGLYEGCSKKTNARECIFQHMNLVIEEVLNREVSNDVPEEISKDYWIFRHMGVNYHWMMKLEHVKGRSGYY
jgi:hypothetical protein